MVSRIEAREVIGSVKLVEVCSERLNLQELCHEYQGAERKLRLLLRASVAYR